MLPEIDPTDIVSVRRYAYGASVMVKDRAACKQKYSGAVIDAPTLDDILLYYVKGKSGKEWRE